ncbi:MAG TPA: type IV pilus twitching motility protein PilT [Candidatus Bathyarchaeia archaeon]|nr:type IV pilus twitching motility protein PilT [Candidatus Bathyarchaeia archaeon]
MPQLEQLLAVTIQSNASDLHLLVGAAPILRVDGDLLPIPQQALLTNEVVKELVFMMLTPQQKEILLTNKEIDFSYEFEGKARFRINAYFERNNLAVALRLIPMRIKPLEELNLPRICHRFTQLKAGFILVTGPTGHGKSSTLAAIIEEINQTRKEHIITIEDPIEYVYRNAKSIISQRELGHDTLSWSVALRSALREDPDVVLVGEMRDYETIAAALTIAETGHLVFATLHTNSAAQTIDRIVDVFPEHQQAQVRMQLSNSLESVLSQRLIPAIEGGRLPATEVLLATPAVRSTIREGKTHLIDNIIQTSQELGMLSLEKSLADWVRAGKISQEVATSWCLRPEELMRMLGGR